MTDRLSDARGADVNLRDRWILAARRGGLKGHRAVADLLIRSGARVTTPVRHRRDAAQRGGRQGPSRGGELLLAKGADINSRDRNGAYPAENATRFRHIDVIEALRRVATGGWHPA
jgi:ankyrin repeat protein